MPGEFHAHPWRRRSSISATRFFRCDNCGLVMSAGAGGVFFRRVGAQAPWIELKPRAGSLAELEPRRDARLSLEDEPSCMSAFTAEQLIKQSRRVVLELLGARAADIALPLEARRATHAVRVELSRQRQASKSVRA